jgi:LL-diaminopimelate aminotransferase
LAQPAERIHKLPGYLFAEVDRKIREAVNRGMDVIRLGIGDPDQPTPDFIILAMQEEAAKPRNHNYPPDDGLTEFKAAVARYYRERHGVDLDPEQEVAPLLGSKEGIAHISACYVNSGDVNLVPDPGYPVYGIGTMFAGGRAVAMPLKAERGYYPDFQAILPEDVQAAKLLFLNYPNNPTGAVATPGFFEEAVAFAAAQDLLICHDAAYTEITFDGEKPLSILEVPGAKDVSIEFGSLSKPFNMTGWRLGYAVGNPEAVALLRRYKSNIDSGVFKAIQYTGAAALTAAETPAFLEDLRAMYRGRRDVVVEGLRDLGWAIDPPRGTFYIWAPVPPGHTSASFVSSVLEKTGVVLTPGRGFGLYGEGYFRIALTVGEERLKEAFRRLKEAGVAYRA